MGKSEEVSLMCFFSHGRDKGILFPIPRDFLGKKSVSLNVRGCSFKCYLSSDGVLRSQESRNFIPTGKVAQGEILGEVFEASSVAIRLLDQDVDVETSVKKACKILKGREVSLSLGAVFDSRGHIVGDISIALQTRQPVSTDAEAKKIQKEKAAAA